MKPFVTALLILPLAVLGSASSPPDISDDMTFNLGPLLPRQGANNNLQVFTGALGGAGAPAITQSDDPKQPFEVDGDKFVRFFFPSLLYGGEEGRWVEGEGGESGRDIADGRARGRRRKGKWEKDVGKAGKESGMVCTEEDIGSDKAYRADDNVLRCQTDFKTAANRACDNQHNSCADLANSKKGQFSVGQCDQQSSECSPPPIP